MEEELLRLYVALLKRYGLEDEKLEEYELKVTDVFQSGLSVEFTHAILDAARAACHNDVLLAAKRLGWRTASSFYRAYREGKVSSKVIARVMSKFRKYVVYDAVCAVFEGYRLAISFSRKLLENVDKEITQEELDKCFRIIRSPTPATVAAGDPDVSEWMPTFLLTVLTLSGPKEALNEELP